MVGCMVAVRMWAGCESASHSLQRMRLHSQGFPIMFNHCDADRMAVAFSHNRDARLIMETTGDSVAFAVRVRVFPYPEDTVAVWVFLGVRFKPYADVFTSPSV